MVVQQKMREDRVKEEGKERSSHRLSIRVYHSSMQFGVWPRRLETKPERLYGSPPDGLMRTELSLCMFYHLFTMAKILTF